MGVDRIEFDPIEVSFVCRSCDRVTWTETTEPDPEQPQDEPDDDLDLDLDDEGTSDD